MDDFFDYNDYYNELASYKTEPHISEKKYTVPKQATMNVHYPSLENFNEGFGDEKLFLYFIIILLICVIIVMNVNYNKQIYKLTKKQIQVI